MTTDLTTALLAQQQTAMQQQSNPLLQQQSNPLAQFAQQGQQQSNPLLQQGQQTNPLAQFAQQGQQQSNPLLQQGQQTNPLAQFAQQQTNPALAQYMQQQQVNPLSQLTQQLSNTSLGQPSVSNPFANMQLPIGNSQQMMFSMPQGMGVPQNLGFNPTQQLAEPPKAYGDFSAIADASPSTEITLTISPLSVIAPGHDVSHQELVKHVAELQLSVQHALTTITALCNKANKKKSSTGTKITKNFVLSKILQDPNHELTLKLGTVVVSLKKQPAYTSAADDQKLDILVSSMFEFAKNHEQAKKMNVKGYLDEQVAKWKAANAPAKTKAKKKKATA